MRNRYLADGEITVMDPPDEEEPLPEEDPQAEPMQELDGYPQSGFVQDIQQADAAPPAEYLDAPPQAYAAPPSSPIRIALPPPPRVAAERLEKLIGEAPTKSHPNWMQRVGAGVLGGLAGWSNAAGRARPIDIGEATEGILHPGYQGKLAEWQSRVAPAQAAAKLEGERINQGTQQHTLESQAELRSAQAEAATQHGAYWKHRAETESNRYRMNTKGQVVDMKTGEVKNGPPSFNDKYQEAIKNGRSKDEAWAYASGQKLPAAKAERNLNLNDVLLNPDRYSPDQVKKAQEMFDKEHRPPREPRDPNAPRAITNSQKLQIESRKNTRLDSLRVWAAAEAAKDPAFKDSVDAVVERQKQEIQDQYENEIQSVTGASPGHYSYKLDDRQVSKTVPPKQGGGRGGNTAPAAQPKAPAVQQSPTRRFNKNGDGVEWDGKKWNPIPRR